MDDGPLAGRLQRLHTLLLDSATWLEAQELVMGAVLAMVQRYATQPIAAPTRWQPDPRQGGPGQRLVDLVRRPVVTSDAGGQPAIAGPVIRALLAADWAGAVTARLASIPAARAWTSRPWRGRR